MKKILAFALAATLLCAMFVMPSAADDAINFEQEIGYVETAPNVDGTVNAMEYGTISAIHSYSENASQFKTDHDDYKDWDVEFYAAWDEEKLYFAWVVESEVHNPLAKDKMGLETDTNGIYGPMWQYSCVQFILTPGAPGQGKSYSGDYLEIGLCLLEDGSIGRVAWSVPKGVDKESISLNDWDAAIVRDDANGTTTYEVAIPKMMSGLSEFGTDAQFGLLYAAAAQEDYNTKKGMLEWQDGTLGGKNPDNGAIVTLTGGNVETVKPNEGLQEGELPEEVTEDTIQLKLDKTEGYLAGEDSIIVTDMAEIPNYNNNNALSLILAPVEGGEEGEYEVIERKQGTGEFVEFDTETNEDTVIVAFTTAGEGNSGYDRWATASTIGEGSIVKIFGVDIEAGEFIYDNAMVYVTDFVEYVEPEEPVESSEEPVESSEEESVEASEEESEEESKEESKETSKNTSKAPATSLAAPADEDDGAPVGLIVGIIAAVVVIAVVVVIVIKKKKA